MKRKKPIKAITMIELGLAAVLLIVLSLLVYWYSDGLSSYTPKAVTYQCIGDDRLEFSEDARFRENEHGVSFSDNENEGEIDKVPILVKDSTDLILSRNYEWMDPKVAIQVKRLNRFTRVSNSSGVFIFTANKKKATALGGFLFDGEDVFIFLEDTSISIGHNVVKVPPMSYALVKYDRYVEIHNSETDEVTTIGILNVDVTADCAGGYTLDLVRDVINYNGEEAILFSALDYVKVMEME